MRRQVTDDKSMGKEERKKFQVHHAPQISREAKLVKLADKLYNLSGLLTNKPKTWSAVRTQGYFVWAQRVVAGTLLLYIRKDMLPREARTSCYVLFVSAIGGGREIVSRVTDITDKDYAERTKHWKRNSMKCLRANSKRMGNTILRSQRATWISFWRSITRACAWQMTRSPRPSRHHVPVIPNTLECWCAIEGTINVLPFYTTALFMTE